MKRKKTETPKPDKKLAERIKALEERNEVTDFLSAHPVGYHVDVNNSFSRVIGDWEHSLDVAIAANKKIYRTTILLVDAGYVHVESTSKTQNDRLKICVQRQARNGATSGYDYYVITPEEGITQEFSLKGRVDLGMVFG